MPSPYGLELSQKTESTAEDAEDAETTSAFSASFAVQLLSEDLHGFCRSATVLLLLLRRRKLFARALDR